MKKIKRVLALSLLCLVWLFPQPALASEPSPFQPRAIVTGNGGTLYIISARGKPQTLVVSGTSWNGKSISNTVRRNYKIKKIIFYGTAVDTNNRWYRTLPNVENSRY